MINSWRNPIIPAESGRFWDRFFKGPAKHPYERLVWSLSRQEHRLPYWVIWPLIGLLLFAVGDLVVVVSGDRNYLVTEAICGAAIGGIPALLVFMSHTFDSNINTEEGKSESLAGILRPPGDQTFQQFLSRRQPHIFELRSRRARFAVIGIMLLGLLTILFAWLQGSGPPFTNPVDNLVGFVFFILLLWFFGHAAFTFAQLLRLLSDMGNFDVQVPFYRIPHPAIGALQRYYSWLAVLTVAGYCVLVVAIWQGPFRNGDLVLPWLFCIAAFPFMATTWSFLWVHTLLRKAKRHHLDKASDFVIAALDLQETARRDPRLLDARLSPEVLNSRLEALQKALAVQESTQRLPEWPFAISTTFAFVGTVGTVLAQVAYAWGQQIANALPFHW